MIDYFDASAIAAIILDERAGDAVSRLIPETDATIISQFGIGEASSAISRLVRMQKMTEQHGYHLIDQLDHWADQTADMIDLEDEDFIEATRLVRRFELRLRTPDALHLAVATRLGVRLVTLDITLAAAGRAIGTNVINPVQS